MASGKGGGALVPLLALLLLLGGAGAWNYQRNAAREQEQQVDRPMRGYSTPDLEKLLAAYEQEADRLGRRERATRRAVVREQPGQLVAEGANEFARVQRASARVRDAKGDLAEAELMIARIQEELNARAGDAVGMDLHLRRLTTLDF
jgi:hypothetical protein